MNSIVRSIGRWLERIRRPGELALVWSQCEPCPARRTEPGAITFGSRFLAVGGYESIDFVHGVIDVFDLARARWTDRIDLPPGVPQTHMGIASEADRYIYIVGGQIGPHCRPARADVFVFDLQTASWNRLPSLPEPRYGPTVQFWRGRLHAFSGAKPDRWTSACDYWSIAVKEGKALEDQWREEPPVPRGGPHRASVILGEKLYVFGGQDGDVKPIAGDSNYTCDWNTPFEKLYADSFVFGPDGRWSSIAPMPVACTHGESIAIVGDCAILAGGNLHRQRLSDLVQMYDSQRNRWRIIGRLPYAMKTSAAYYDGWLYAIAGQRSQSDKNLRPHEVTNTVWRTKFSVP